MLLVTPSVNTLVNQAGSSVGTSALANGGTVIVGTSDYLKKVANVNTAAFLREIAAPMMELTMITVLEMLHAPLDKL